MRIEELKLQNGDLARQGEFYASLLGLAVLAEGHEALVLEAGSSKLIFTRAAHDWSGQYHFAFNIPENRFSEAKEWASQRVPLIKSSSGQDEFNFEHWNAHALYFYDPAGNIVEFIARHDLSEQADMRPFSAQRILSVSEIGLATEDVPSTVQLLADRMSVNIYDGAGSDAFTAVGDVYGLFIVVKEGRVWFPDTGKQAELLPVNATVQASNGDRYSLTGPPYQVSLRGVV